MGCNGSLPRKPIPALNWLHHEAVNDQQSDRPGGRTNLLLSRGPRAHRTRESVNASCPVVFDNKVFISASYRAGSALVEVRPDFTHRVVWTTPQVGFHFNTSIYRDGYLYCSDGRNEPDASD